MANMKLRGNEHMRFIQLMTISLVAVLAYAHVGYSSTVDLPSTTDLQADGALALKKQLPIMVVFTAENCPYCSALESDQLRPMMISGDYDNKVIIRTLQIDSFKDITFFNGKAISAEALAQKFNIWVTPTIMFFDHEGHTLAPKIVGYNTPEMFGGYLDDSIDQSRQMIRSELASNGGKTKPAI